ncbi:MAG: GtrA family protein [Rikenellaceae bacterium]
MSVNSAISSAIARCIDVGYLPIIERFISRTSYRYAACGVVNYFVLDTLLYYIIYHYIVSERYIDLAIVVVSPHISSMIMLFPFTFLTGFWLNRHVAFQVSEMPARGQIVRYAISIGGSITLSYLALKMLVELFGVWATPAKLCSSIITAVYSYMMARLFTFKKGAGSEACANRK